MKVTIVKATGLRHPLTPAARGDVTGVLPVAAGQWYPQRQTDSAPRSPHPPPPPLQRGEIETNSSE